MTTMNLLEKIDELRAQSVTAEKFEEVWGVDLEAHLDELMDFVKEQNASQVKNEK